MSAVVCTLRGIPPPEAKRLTWSSFWKSCERKDPLHSVIPAD